MILTTSNVTGAIDLAFVDRADIKQYIGPPSPAAIFKIYHSCITELMRVRIIKAPNFLFICQILSWCTHINQRGFLLNVILSLEILI